MFEHTSRYAHLEEAIHVTREGREIKYVRRRFLPRGGELPVLTDAEVEVNDRIDLVASRTLGDAQQSWQVCDANNAMNPFALTAEVGRILRIPIPQFPEA